MNILNESNVTLDGKFLPLLQDLQAHILKHHGRMFSRHLFLQFNGGHNPIRSWLKSLQLTSAEKQLKDVEAFHKDKLFDSGTVITCSLSATGYRKIRMSNLNFPSDLAFTEGMKKRQSILKDMPETWEKGFQGDIDALILIADANEERASVAVENVKKAINRFASVVLDQRGKILKKGNLAIEHFGYADGISQPLYLKSDIEKQGNTAIWDDMATLDRLLVHDKGGRTSNSFGSYLVFRKLEQNVKAFKEAEARLADVVKNDKGIPNDELAGAMTIGRFEDGTETIHFCEEKSTISNDFDYASDPQGLKCPYHAHIRLTNPRTDIGINDAKKMRITRRGVPYNDVKRNELSLENDLPTEGVGLLFLCYQKSIIEQFEKIQTIANTGKIEGDSVGQDAIIGQGRALGIKTLPEQWGEQGRSCPINFGGFVKMLGGEYFFTPSISFFKSL